MKEFEPILKAVLKRKEIQTDEEIGILKDLCDIVYRKHFKYKVSQEKDLLQEGFIGCIEIIRKGDFNDSYPATPYLYTRIRNCMSNFLSKKTPSLLTSDEEEYVMETGDVGCEKNSHLIELIITYVRKRLDQLEVEKVMASYVETYFVNKFGVSQMGIEPRDVILDFVTTYNFYISTFEYEIADKYLYGPIFSNKIDDIFDVLDSDGDLPLLTKLMNEVFPQKVVTKLLYILSGTSFKYPSKMKLYRTDYNLTIYSSIKRGKFTIQEAAKFYKKTPEVIGQIVTKYDKVFP